MSRSIIRHVNAAACSAAEIDESCSALKFGHSEGFLVALRQRVDDYFAATGLSKRDCPQMYLKTAIILVWCCASWAVLVFGVSHFWTAVLAAVSLGFSMSAVGFNVQHDASHQAYSRRRWVNSLMAMTLDVLGGSSYFWKRTHNLVHHSFTNITGHDGDIDLGALGRLSPHQPRYWYHRWQHLYLWFLYGFLPVKWQFVDDTLGLVKGRIGHYQYLRPTGRDLAVLLGGKLLFLTLAFGIPLYFHPWYAVLGFYFLTSFAQGLLLSVVFQLAHCLEEAEFPMPQETTGRIEHDWAVHQVETTVDCARDNRLLSWFVGGLNFQVEHHLFPQICHIHYPAISRVVEETCGEFGLRYRCNETILGAIRSHYRWLQRLGRSASADSRAMPGDGSPAAA